MPFSDQQVKLLSSKLCEKHVKTREQHGKTLSYIEGWHVIAEANRIFGFDGWDRETVVTECVWQDGKREPKACAYAVRVRIRVRASETVVCREGSGFGSGTAATLGEAHESALKEAETDAMKRALATFGNQFGLALYDKQQNGVRRRGHPNGGAAAGISWVLLSGTGARLSRHELPEAFCGELRRAIEKATIVHRLEALWARNLPTVSHLRVAWAELRTVNGTHYADVLEQLYNQNLKQLKSATPQEPRADATTTLDKVQLPLAAPKRVRDPAHLKFVASLPCVICGRVPSHAHHLRFAQLRSLGSKVSDEWTVPLCAAHHRSLHDVGAEAKWWQERNVNALAEAEKLWRESRGTELDHGPTKPTHVETTREDQPNLTESA
jgi:DNA recombination protein Rad52